ncbi:MAG: hypothetical protein C0490_10455 [Marivirga sp.]|nr:hypothetical protein [Marivirga sp.]
MMQTIDPQISKSKFDDELEIFLKVQDTQRQRGILLLKEEFPNAYFAFGVPSLNPCPIIFAVKINFENYDLEPLSVQFIHPFTFRPLKLQDVATHFNRNIGQNGTVILQALLQEEQSPESLPFLCIPGIREYHNHPAHSGDSWLLHRKNAGEGSLGFVIEKLFDYGISAINSFQLPAIGMNRLHLGLNLTTVPK